MEGGNQEKFNRLLDRMVKRNIKQILQDDVMYFRDHVAAAELLPHLTCISPTQRQRIERVVDRDGNIPAVHRLMDEVTRYGNFAIQLLRGLVENNHRDVAIRILQGLDLSSLPECGYTSFIEDLRYDRGDSPSPPSQQDLPPSYESIPGAVPLSLMDQMEQYSKYQNGSTSTISSVSSLDRSTITPEIPTVTNISTTQMNIVPSTSTRDGNLSSIQVQGWPFVVDDDIHSDDIQSSVHTAITEPNDSNEDNEEQNQEEVPGNIVEMDLSNSAVGSSQSPTIREPTENYAAGIQNKTRQLQPVDDTHIEIPQPTEYPGYSFRTVEIPGCTIPPPVSDISLSEVCISESDSNDGGNVTVPKRLFTRSDVVNEVETVTKRMSTARDRSNEVGMHSSGEDENELKKSVADDNEEHVSLPVIKPDKLASEDESSTLPKETFSVSKSLCSSGYLPNSGPESVSNSLFSIADDSEEHVSLRVIKPDNLASEDKSSTSSLPEETLSVSKSLFSSEWPPNSGENLPNSEQANQEAHDFENGGSITAAFENSDCVTTVLERRSVVEEGCEVENISAMDYEQANGPDDNVSAIDDEQVDVPSNDVLVRDAAYAADDTNWNIPVVILAVFTTVIGQLVKRY